MPAIGERFVVTEVHEHRTPKGRLLARYRPEFDYRITASNLELVAGLIASGKARIGTRSAADKLAAATGKGIALGSASGRVRGTVNTGKAK